MKHVLKTIYAILLAFILLFAPRIGRWVANLFDFDQIDPDGAFMWISVRHITQTLVILILIVVITKISKIQFNLGMGDKKIGFSYLKKFMIYFTIYTVIVFAVTVISGGFQSFIHPLNARNIIGYLGFQLVLSGPSEELIFRAFAMTMFAFLVSNKRLDRRMSYANLFAMIIFGVAHIYFTFNPFGMSYDIGQVLFAMALGYFYGDCYEKSKSFVYPMLMHSFSNVLMMSITIILSAIL